MQPKHMKSARDYTMPSMHMKPSGDHNMQPAYIKPSRRQIAQPMRAKPPAARRPMLPNNKRSRRRRPRRRVYHPTLPSKYRSYDDLNVEIYLLIFLMIILSIRPRRPLAVLLLGHRMIVKWYKSVKL